MTRVPIVDEHDEIVGYKERDELVDEDRIRCSVVLLQSPAGKYLLARRSLTKRSDPGLWGPSAGGTIEEGETYASNIVKELEEELGVTTAKLHKGAKIDVDNTFAQQFFGELNEGAQFTLQESEVMDARWFTAEELVAMHDENPHQFTVLVRDWIGKELKK